MSDKGSIFVPHILSEVASVLGVQLRHAPTKHAQTNDILERAHTSVEVTLQMIKGKF